MIDFFMFIVVMLGIFGVLTSAVFYGDRVVGKGGDITHFIDYQVRYMFNYKENKKRAIKAKQSAQQMEYYNALRLEREAHKREVGLAQARQVVDWETKFYDGKPPKEILQLGEKVAAQYALPTLAKGPKELPSPKVDLMSELLAIGAPKEKVGIGSIRNRPYGTNAYEIIDGEPILSEEATRRMQDQRIQSTYNKRDTIKTPRKTYLESDGGIIDVIEH